MRRKKTRKHLESEKVKSMGDSCIELIKMSKHHQAR